MQEVKGNLFTYNPRSVPLENVPDTVEELLTFKSTHGNVLRCITTNGVVSSNGYLVMGAGFAKQAKRRFPELPYIFGQKIDERGNHVYIAKKYGIASFPTKQHWKDNSDINLILRSCRELACFGKDWDYILLSRPGCTNGGFEWDYIKPLLEPIFNRDKFIIVHA